MRWQVERTRPENEQSAVHSACGAVAQKYWMPPENTSSTEEVNEHYARRRSLHYHIFNGGCKAWARKDAFRGEGVIIRGRSGGLVHPKGVRSSNCRAIEFDGRKSCVFSNGHGIRAGEYPPSKNTGGPQYQVLQFVNAKEDRRNRHRSQRTVKGVLKVGGGFVDLTGGFLWGQDTGVKKWEKTGFEHSGR